MTADPYQTGRDKGCEERIRLTDAHSPIIPTYLAAQAAVRESRYTPIMSDALTKAHRRSRAYALGYLRGFRI